MTLIEVTVALGIAVVLFGSAVWGIGALTGTKAKEGSAQLAGTIRSLYDMAALSGKTCRLVFELPNERDEEGETTWRAECAKGNITAAAKREDELREANSKGKKDGRDEPSDRRLRRMDSDSAPTVQELQEQEKARVDDAAKFSAFTNGQVTTYTLPSNVKLEVWTQKLRQPVKNGVAYLYFFPQGYTERAQVWVRQGKNVWTLKISPLTGKTVIVAEDLEVPRT